MFDHKHYVPILKGKAGEYGALEELSTTAKARLTPFVEIPPIPWDFESELPAKSPEDHLRNVAERIGNSWGVDSPVFIDLLFIEAQQIPGRGHPLNFVFDAARQRGVQAIPVTGLDRDQPYQSAIRDIINMDQRGAGVRLQTSDFEEEADLDAALTDLLGFFHLPHGMVDLILDFQSILPDQANAIRRAVRSMLASLPSITDWRTLTFSASAFPQNLSGFAADTITPVPRAEWTVWVTLAARRQRLPRLPTFSDYAIQYPEPIEVDPRIMQMSANLRYTADRDWLILKGRGVRRQGFDQFRDLCSSLMQEPEYRGPQFSWGDQYIDRCANQLGGPGNATIWRKVGTNHHLEFVVRQIANVP